MYFPKLTRNIVNLDTILKTLNKCLKGIYSDMFSNMLDLRQLDGTYQCCDNKLRFRVTLTSLPCSHQLALTAALLYELYLYNKETIKYSLKRERK